MKISLVNYKNQDTGKKVTLSDSIFNINPNQNAIYLDIKNIRLNQRQATHKKKNRSLVKGSTRKIKKQKGTGTARAGDIKSPLFRGGGRTFAPSPNYKFKINKKIKKLAKKSILSYKNKKKRYNCNRKFKF